MEWNFELLKKLPTITEGPVWDGERVLFTNIPASLILHYDPKTRGITEGRTGTNRTNGLAFDAQGRLFGCCSGGRSILRFDPDGRNATVADNVNGKKLNTPNDLAIDRKGRIWFTNPWNAHNLAADAHEDPGYRSVMRADPQADGSYKVTRVHAGSFLPGRDPSRGLGDLSVRVP